MTVLDKIVQWNKERNNVEFNLVNEHSMLQEELNELFDAMDESDIVDALCDIIVVATGAIHKLGYNPNISMNETLKEISSRQQDPIQKDIWKKWGASGKWEKNKSQEPSTLYKADYTKAQYIKPKYSKQVVCEECGATKDMGNRGKYCSNACKQKAYRERKAKD